MEWVILLAIDESKAEMPNSKEKQKQFGKSTN